MKTKSIREDVRPFITGTHDLRQLSARLGAEVSLRRGIKGNNAARLLLLFPLFLTGMSAQPSDEAARASVVVSGTAAGVAQAKDSTIEQLLKRITEMEVAQKRMQDKLDGLPTETVATPPAAVPPAGATAAAAATQTAESGQADRADVAEPSHTLGPVEFHGFSDFGYGRSWFEKRPPGGLNGSPHSFNIGDFDLFTNTRISEHWSIVGEMLVTSDFTNNFGVEMDRLLFSYKPSDYFNISFGKFNTALGYYPNAFHRARYFQTATSRPIMYSDEDNGGILPVHSIGIAATGKIPSGVLGLHWVAELANGRSSSDPEAPIQNFVDEGNGKAVNLALYARPERLRGFQTGFSVYHDTMHPANFRAIDQDIYTGHVVYVGSKLEFLNEASLVRHAIQGANQVFRSVTAYSQLSYAFGKTRPFARYDYQNVPASDPVFGLAGRVSGPSLGIYRHLSNYVVLKLQYGLFGQRGLSSANDLQAQLAFAF